MDHNHVVYRRSFDWFSSIYPVVPVGLAHWVMAHYGTSPFRQPVFWMIVVAVLAGQGIYFLAASRSPHQLVIEGEDLVVRWRSGKREIRVPRHQVRCDKSLWFNPGCVLWCAGQKVLIVPNHRTTIRALEAAIQEHKTNAT